MANITINQLPAANSIDPVQDLLPIYTNSLTATQSINRNTFLGLSSAPVGLTDNQTLTNKTLTSPTISGPTLSGTVSGTYTIGGTPTFPSSVVTLTGTQTLTNKTLTSPTINSPSITNASITADTVAGYTSTEDGTIYGMSVSSGQITNSSIANGTIGNTQIATGGLYATKLYNPYKFSVYLSTNQTVSTGWNLVELDSKQFDTSSNFDDSVDYQFTTPVTGFYQFEGSVYLSGLSDADLIAVGLNVGTFSSSPTYTNAQTLIGGGTSSGSLSFSMLLNLTANQTVQLYAYTPRTTINGGSGDTFMMGYLVSTT